MDKIFVYLRSSIFSRLSVNSRIILGVLGGMIIFSFITLTSFIIHFQRVETLRHEIHKEAVQKSQKLQQALTQTGRSLLNLPKKSNLKILTWSERVRLDKLPWEVLELVRQREPEKAKLLTRLKREQVLLMDSKTPSELEKEFETAFLRYCLRPNPENTLVAQFLLEKLKAKLPPDDARLNQSLADLKPSNLSQQEWEHIKTTLLTQVQNIISGPSDNIDKEQIDQILKQLQSERMRFPGEDDQVPHMIDRGKFTKTLCMNALREASDKFDADLKTKPYSELAGLVQTWARRLPALKRCAKVTASSRPYLDDLLTVDAVRDRFLLSAWTPFYQILRQHFLEAKK